MLRRSYRMRNKMLLSKGLEVEKEHHTRGWETW